MNSSDARLAALRNRFEEQKKQKEERDSNKSSYYPFFAMDFDKEAIIRFLPDANENNPDLFMISSNTHNLELNGQQEKVPCMKNYGHSSCPICDVSQGYYKKEGKNSVNGKKYWTKKQYLARVIVIKDPLPVKEGSESYQGKICVIALSGDLYAKIMSAIMSPSDPLPYMPDDLKNGTNFIIRKTKNGEYASYDNSGFARNSSPCPIEIDPEKDLVDLSTFLKREPSQDEVEKKLQASLTGIPYDDGSSAFRQTRTGIQSLLNNSDEPATSSVASVLSTDEESGASGGDKYQEILNRAKQRRAQA